MRRFNTLAAAPLVVLAFHSAVHGSALSYFDNRNEFARAVNGFTAVRFEGIADSQDYRFLPSPPGITLNGAKFTIDRTTSNGNLYVIGPSFYYRDNSVLSSQQSTTGPYNVLVTLPGLYMAVATDFGVVNPGVHVPFTFTLSTGESFTRSHVGGPSLTFVGLISPQPIEWIKISIPRVGYALNIDNFLFATAVPEPSSLVLAFAGMVAVIGAGRHR